MDASRHTITMTRSVPAPPAQVYRAWTDADVLATWWWPHLTGTTYDLDVRVGGGYRIRAGVAGIGVHGTYRTLDEPHRLEFTWVWEDGTTDGPQEDVTVVLEPDGYATVVRVVHVLAPASDGEDFRRGWTDCLARLGELSS